MPYNLLIVDDNEDIRLMLSKLLATDGRWETHEADSGEQALEIFGSVAPDAVLLDYTLPDLTGVELSEVLRGDRGYKGPLILYSSFAVEQQRETVSRLNLILVDKTNIRHLTGVLDKIIEEAAG